MEGTIGARFNGVADVTIEGSAGFATALSIASPGILCDCVSRKVSLRERKAQKEHQRLKYGQHKVATNGGGREGIHHADL